MPKYLFCSVTDIFSVEYWRDLELWVRGRSRSLETAPFNRKHTTDGRIPILVAVLTRDKTSAQLNWKSQLNFLLWIGLWKQLETDMIKRNIYDNVSILSAQMNADARYW